MIEANSKLFFFPEKYVDEKNNNKQNNDIKNGIDFVKLQDDYG